MKPLLVLLSVFVIAIVLIKVFVGQYDIAFAARIGMSCMLLFTTIGHFAFTKGMEMMIPNFIPYKAAMVYLTGVIEIMASIGLQIPSLQITTAWLLILFFILMLPANINAAVRNIDYQKGTNDGSGVTYLWFRIPLQLLFIGWVYFSSIY